ncbi:MAG: hypothetical protein K2X39_05430, partial [Silvanigrellaceae bacterium]|nr:hypothetical protein [Silvanigrellaceae bacterium]
KPYFNRFFEISGKIIVESGAWFTKVTRKVSPYLNQISEAADSFVQKSFKVFSLLLTQEAQAAVEEKRESREDENSPDQVPYYDVYLSGGILKPTTDRVVLKKYYNSNFFVGHFGLNYLLPTNHLNFFAGPAVSYLYSSGHSSASGKSFDIHLYSLGARANAGMKVRSRYVVPWFLIGGGVDRFREEMASYQQGNSSNSAQGAASNPETTAASTEESTTAAATAKTTDSSSDFQSPLGVSLWKPIVTIKGGLEVNLSNIFYKNYYDYSPKDILLRFSFGYQKDLSRKGVLLDGFLYEAGIDFLL